MNFIAFMIVVFLDPVITESVQLSSGVIVVNGLETKVGNGTFIPAPADEILAKKILDKNVMIEELQIRLDTCGKKSDLLLSTRIERELEINKHWRSRYNELELENILLTSWWNRWGKTVVWCLVSAGAAAIVSWEIHNYLEK